ncbi:MAG: phosphoribosyltransferase [Longimicrobiales bacterium]
MQRFRDRSEAGRLLAEALAEFRGDPALIVLGLPRGGVPVAAEVAKGLDSPLDIFLVRKLGLPSHPELAMGALASGGAVVLNDDVVDAYRVPQEVIEDVARDEVQELERRERVYRGDRPRPDLAGRTVILVDDGLATGASMRAAAVAARQQRPARLIIAVPVGAPATCATLREVADDVVCLRMPARFDAVGLWYQDFDQTSDEEVVRLLSRS